MACGACGGRAGKWVSGEVAVHLGPPVLDKVERSWSCWRHPNASGVGVNVACAMGKHSFLRSPWDFLEGGCRRVRTAFPLEAPGARLCGPSVPHEMHRMCPRVRRRGVLRIIVMYWRTTLAPTSSFFMEPAATRHLLQGALQLALQRVAAAIRGQLDLGGARVRHRQPLVG